MLNVLAKAIEHLHGAPYPVRPDMPDVSIPMHPLSETRQHELMHFWRNWRGLPQTGAPLG